MKIVVLVKEVPDTYGDRRIVLETGLVDRAASDRVNDEIGERAVEAALGLIRWSEAALLAVAQVAGGVLGALVANLMFDLEAVSWSTHERTGGDLWLAEVVATLGLVLIVFGALRSGRTETIAYAVGGYIAAAYWFTSSTSFANPAVTVARMFSDTFAGIDPTSVPVFVGMQVLGGLLALALVRSLFPAEETA